MDLLYLVLCIHMMMTSVTQRVQAIPGMTLDEHSPNLTLKLLNRCLRIHKKSSTVQDLTCQQSAQLLSCVNLTREITPPTHQEKTNKTLHTLWNHVKACEVNEGCHNTWAPENENGKRILNCRNARWLLDCDEDRYQVLKMIEFCESDKIDLCLLEFAPRYVINCRTGSKLHMCLQKVKKVKDVLVERGRIFHLEEHIEDLLENNDCPPLDYYARECPANQVINSVSKKCEPCPKGQKRVENWGHVSCDCKDDKVLIWFQKRCKACPEGYVIVKEYNGHGKCDCPGDTVHQWSWEKQKYVCKPCDQGTFKQRYSLMRAICSKCQDSNSYYDEANQRCKQCPDGEVMYSDYEGKSFCGCDGDKVRNDLTGRCERCKGGSLKVIWGGKVGCYCLGETVFFPGGRCERCPEGTHKLLSPSQHGYCECDGNKKLNTETKQCEECPAGTEKTASYEGTVSCSKA